MMEPQDAYRRRVRRAFERRLGRPLTDMEFEKLLRIGHGLFWDYDPYGHIDPYDPVTLRSNVQAWSEMKSPSPQNKPQTAAASAH
jgi:hypothetical protein